MNAGSPLIFSLSESRSLGQAIAAAAGLEPAPLEERGFEAGEFKLRPLVPVRDRDVYVVQLLANSPDATVSERLLRLLLLAFGLRDAGARRLTAFTPYLCFARKDRRTQTRDPVTVRYVAQLLESAGIGRLVALDVHNPAAFDNAFRIPTDHLSALPLFVSHFAAASLPDAPLAVASPDVGGVKRAQLFREQLERRLGRDVELVFIEKRRARGVTSGGTVIGEVAGRDAIVLDDLCASGGTLIRAASALRSAGARRVQVAFTHAPHPPGLRALAAAGEIDGIVLTDSTGPAMQGTALELGGRVTVLSIAPLLGAALSRMLAHRPVSVLLEQFPVPDAG
ncbi:MAG TPA: ribose-phosphate diphosphokinase [Steroidobacteraceae bacterium]|jgi:ribose-phosphate pyrophosphokinase|nr:ribose-phosphate diphosphokinase [Steroidobacteraceae bacterium]